MNTFGSLSQSLLMDESRLYCFACQFLWNALSLYWHLMQHVAPEVFNQFYMKWETDYEQLAEWLLDERLPALRLGGFSDQNAFSIVEMADDIGEDLMYRWSDQLESAATWAHTTDSSVGRSTWLHYLYGAFLIGILAEFDNLLQTLGISGVFHARFLNHANLFKAVERAFRNDHRTWPVQSISVNSIEGDFAIQIDLLKAGLVSDWLHEVKAAAQQNK